QQTPPANGSRPPTDMSRTSRGPAADQPRARALTGARGEVEFTDVTFGYGDGPDVLNGFSLRLRAGETVALLGRTGSGKSTAARLLPRFYDVRGGSVTVDGHDVRELTPIACATPSASCWTRRSCSPRRSVTTSPTGAPTRTSPTSSGWPGWPGRTGSSPSCPAATTP
ncbi:ATP-binding cassette domain-containing protein, partial [Catenulispora sp. NL8]|nr:ATP-binding cassette domain-containing protein [Catenulispora pinistramenti]